MNEIFDEYGMTILTSIAGVIILGIVGLVILPGNLLGDGFRAVITATLP